jgi:carbon monoxide dehydrogenase subunit G
MRLDNEFEVPRPVDEAWAVLTDLERIAPCMPGAQLTEVEGETYHGTVKVKVGPMVAQYAGQARFKEKDDAAHHAVLEAKGKERSGKGLASALVTADLTEQGANSTRVTVSTDLTISGPLAQFGRGAIVEVSSKLLGQFSDNLRSMLESGGGSATPPASGNGGGSPEHAAPAGNGSSPDGNSAPSVAAPVDAASTSATATSPSTGEAPTPAEPGAASTTGPAATGTAATGAGALAEASGDAAATPTGRRVVQSREAEPVDLMSVAGSSILKRVIPLVIVVAIVVVLIIWLA